MSVKEGYLHDYLAASFVGFAIGYVVSVGSGLLTMGAGVVYFGVNWGPYIGYLFVAGLFAFVPGGFVAGYLNFRFHRTGEKLEMVGLSAGFFTAFVYTILTLFLSLATVIMGYKADIALVAWILGVLFAFIFFTLGGYISGFLERKPFPMPAIFDLSRISRAGPPPPPAAAAQICPTCGQPLTFIQQYGRWYCANCRKYP